MRKILKILPGLFSLLLCSYYTYGQLDMSRQNKDIEIPNTQTYDFIRYGNNIGASLYTGTVNVSIPFYTYKDPDFEIPISFDYASNGFKPNQRAGDVGLGWMLNTGGCITREVRGIPDEKTVLAENPVPNYQDLVRGFLYVYNKNAINYNEYSEVFARHGCLADAYIYQRYILQQNGVNPYEYYEFEPDIFHFNFMGYSGDFHLWHNGKVKIYNTNFNADELQFNFSGTFGISNIQIKIGNGYTYDFGGNSIEYTKQQKQDQSEDIYHAWKLFKITAPNGRKVEFNYDRPYSDYIDGIYNFNPASIHANNIFVLSSNVGSNTYIHEMSVNSTQMFTQPIKKIQISDGIEIDFNYEKTTGEKRLQGVSNFTVSDEQYVQSYKLNKITVKDIHKNNDNIIKECNISYKYSKTDNITNNKIKNKVYFLEHLNISGEGVYDFEYLDRTTRGFPVLGTFSVDHWGYYNGRSDNNITNFIDYLGYDNYYTETIGTDLRNPNHDYAKMGMLQRISYPTGGHSVLEYEPHDYYMYVNRGLSSLNGDYYEPELLNSENNKTITGGLRIKKVTNFTSAGIISKFKEYFYENPTGMSSGMRLNFPRYGIKYYTDGGLVEYYSLYDHFKYDGTHIGYSKVTEINSDGSKIEYNFTNSNNFDFIDVISVNYYKNTGNLFRCIEYGGPASFTVFRSPNILISILTPVISKQPFRGKLLNKNIISNTGNLLRTETNSYNYKTVHSYDVPLIVSEYYRFVLRQDLNITISSNTATDYFENNAVSASTSYTYNVHGQVSTSTTIDSKGNKIVTKHKYVTDIANPTGIHKAMLDNNVINNAIEDSVYMIKSGTAEKTLVEWRKYNYCQPNTAQKALICLKSVDEYDKQESAWVKASTYIYDKNGRVLEKTDRNGIQTAYVWG